VQLLQGLKVYSLLTVAAAVLLIPAPCRAADLGITSETIVRYLERDDTKGKVYTVVPGYEFLRIDYGNLRSQGVSFHGYGWGRLNLGDNYHTNTTEGQFLYGYLEYLDPKRDYQLRLGRQYIFEGVARESIDGLYAKTDIIPTVTLSAYTGLPVNLNETNGVKGDFTFGTNVKQGLPGHYDLGISYKYTTNDGSVYEQLLGADYSLQLPLNTSLFGRSTYNLHTGGWGEQSVELRVPLSRFELRPFYHYYTYDNFMGKSTVTPLPFRFLAETGEKISIIGTEGFWYPAENIEFAAKYKHYDYENRFSSANTFTALAVIRRQIFSELGFEFGRTDGNLAENRYYYGRSYVYWDIQPAFVTADLVYVHYDEDIYATSSSLFVSLGAGWSFLKKSLSVKLSGDYSQDPYFNKDYRFMVKGSYAFTK
jgi:hypothetical protein